MNSKRFCISCKPCRKTSRFISLGVAFLLAFTLLPVRSAHPAPSKGEWQPISAEDLDLKDNPANPGSPAMILYRESFTDDSDSHETNYYRIKIFNDDGKKYADIEIPFVKGDSSVHDIKARTVHADGTVVNFDGKVLEKEVVKRGGIKVLEKTFTLPDVQAGSIIEYKYRKEWDPNKLYDSNWIIQEALYTRTAVFFFKPYRGPGFSFHWASFRVPKTNSGIKEQNDKSYRFEVDDIPAFEEEDFMPPANELRGQLIRYYTRGSLQTPEEFWKEQGKQLNDSIEKFINNKNAVKDLVARTINPNDPPETKLRKLYARAQNIRNLTDEPGRTKKEEKQENIKENKNVEDMLSHGYAFFNDQNWFFLAMARAAGFEAYPVYVCGRVQSFFHPSVLDQHQLNGAVVEVKIGSQDLFFDPATHGCPFGVLPWAESETSGLRLEKNGGTLITTPPPASSDAVTERRAVLQMEADGTLSGKLQVDFLRQEALRLRRNERQEDEAGRKKDVEKEIKESLPSGAAFELTNVTGWDASEDPIHAEGTLRLSGFALTAGRRTLLPLNFMPSKLPQSFQHAVRTNPVYFRYPFLVRDDFTIQLPTGFRVESLPPDVKVPSGAAEYEISFRQQQGNVLHIQRRLEIKGLSFSVEYYPGVRAFFNKVKIGDEQQAVLQSTQSALQN